MKRLCVVEEVTPFMMLLAVLQTLLHRYTAENDVIVGSPIASRNRAEIQNMLGIFVNTLALRTRIEGHMTFQELLARVREVVLGAYQHQDLPFDMLVEALAVPREANTTPVFQVVFAYQNVPAPEWTFPGLTVDAGNIHNGRAIRAHSGHGGNRRTVSAGRWNTTRIFSIRRPSRNLPPFRLRA